MALLCVASTQATAMIESPPTASTKLDWSPSQLIKLSGPAEFSFPGGLRETFVLRPVDLGNRMTGIQGRSANGALLFIFVAEDHVLSGDVYTRSGRFRLVADESGTYSWVTDPDFPAEFSISDHLGIDGNDVQIPPRNSGLPAMAAATEDPAQDGSYWIDLLVLYTPGYGAEYGPGLRAEIERLVFLNNSYFEASQIPVRLRLVGTASYAGSTETADMRENLAAVSQDAGVAKLRAKVGADLVALLRTMDFHTDLCGLSAGFNGFGHEDPPTSIDSRRDAFFVAGMGKGTQTRKRCEDPIFAHELGHNLSGGHDAPVSLGAYWKSYAHGWQCGVAPGEGIYTTILYSGTGGTGLYDEYRGFLPRAPLYSNPGVTLDGLPCGSDGVEGSEVSEANNARAMTEAAPYVAAYMSPKKSENVVSGLGGVTPLALLGLLAGLCGRYVRNPNGNRHTFFKLMRRTPRSFR